MIFDLIFPEICVGCGVYTKSDKHPYLCGSCFSKIPIHQGSNCIGCNQPVSNGVTCILCRSEYHIDALYTVSDYNHRIVKNLIGCIKYKFVKIASRSLSEKSHLYLSGKTKAGKKTPFSNNTLVMPVPLHKIRFNWRGFNLSEIIANSIAKKYLLPYDDKSLIRIISRKPQADIETRDQRQKNIVGCFSVANDKPVKNRDIILVDDISTTGATLNECARVLKASGAKSVVGFVIARG